MEEITRRQGNKEKNTLNIASADLRIVLIFFVTKRQLLSQVKESKSATPEEQHAAWGKKRFTTHLDNIC